MTKVITPALILASRVSLPGGGTALERYLFETSHIGHYERISQRLALLLEQIRATSPLSGRRLQAFVLRRQPLSTGDWAVIRREIGHDVAEEIQALAREL